MKYEIQLTKNAKKQLKKVDKLQQSRILIKIQVLQTGPRKVGKKLSGRPAYRYRVGDYRVIYEIHDEVVVVLILDIDHRKQVYRKS